jgi:hypothetical protein
MGLGPVWDCWPFFERLITALFLVLAAGYVFVVAFRTITAWKFRA